MNVGDKIREVLKNKGLTQRWLSNEMSINEKTLSGKFSQGSLFADELLTIGSLLDYDLNKFKKESVFMLKYFNVRIIVENDKVLVIGKDKDDEYDLLFAKIEDMSNNKNDKLFKVIDDESIIYRAEFENEVSEILGFDVSKHCEEIKVLFQYFDRYDEVECCGFSITKGKCIDEAIKNLESYEERIFCSESPTDEIENILKEILKRELKKHVKEFERRIDNDDFVWE